MFFAALTSAGLNPVERVVVAQTLTRETGKQAFESLIEQDVDAVIVGPSMRLTAGVHDGISEHGVVVPDDLALISFDQNELASAKPPRLTVIKRRIDEVGRLTGRLPRTDSRSHSHPR